MKEMTSKSSSPIIDLSSLEYFSPFEGLKAKLVHTNTQTIAFWQIDKNALLPSHQHIHEQVTIVTKGILEFTIDGIKTVMKQGMVAVIPSNTEHSAIALSDVEVTDVFLPVRDDFPQN